MPYVHNVEALGWRGVGSDLRGRIVAVERQGDYPWLTRHGRGLKDLVRQIIESSQPHQSFAFVRVVPIVAFDSDRGVVHAVGVEDGPAAARHPGQDSGQSQPAHPLEPRLDNKHHVVEGAGLC